LAVPRQGAGSAPDFEFGPTVRYDAASMIRTAAAREGECHATYKAPVEDVCFCSKPTSSKSRVSRNLPGFCRASPDVLPSHVSATAARFCEEVSPRSNLAWAERGGVAAAGRGWAGSRDGLPDFKGRLPPTTRGGLIGISMAPSYGGLACRWR